MKKNTINYFEVQMKSLGNAILFKSLKDFAKYLEHQHVNTVFKAYVTEEEKNYFTIFQQSYLLGNLTEGYLTLEDFEKAAEAGFESSADYYEAFNAGYKNYQDYVAAKNSGISDISTYDTMKKLGFLDGMQEYESALENNFILVEEAKSKETPLELYQFAEAHYYKNFTDFLDGIKTGYLEGEIYYVAKDAGFENFAQYKDSMKRGFVNIHNMNFANEKGIKTFDEFTKYLHFEKNKNPEESHDEALVLFLLSKLEQGKKISINKIYNLLEKSKIEHFDKEENKLPPWFQCKIENLEGLEQFITQCKRIKYFGKYDQDGEFFEVATFQERAIVLDASNIAHNSAIRSEKKVLASNINLMINFLMSKGFNDITTIADASLRRKLEDLENLETVKKISNYIETPRDTSADIFIIEYVKKNNCLLVTNDGFRDWKLKDPWVAENIDFYKMAFLIKGNQVIMPDLK